MYIDLTSLIAILTIIDTVILGTFAIGRTYYARKSAKLQEQMLMESRDYWGTWKRRSEDIAKRVEKDVEKKVEEEFSKLELELNGKKNKNIQRTRTRNSDSRRAESKE